MLTSAQIAQAKAGRKSRTEGHHEHDDCVRIAYEWLAAQKRVAAPNTRTTRPLKHIIEAWAGRYVSQSDVEVAALLHPDLRGEYPWFNISSRLVEPARRRLDGIGEAGKHPSYMDKYTHRPEDNPYASAEV